MSKGYLVHTQLNARFVQLDVFDLTHRRDYTRHEIGLYLMSPTSILIKYTGVLMQSASIPSNEFDRIKELVRYDILDSPPEQPLDDLAIIASQICDTPISLVSLVDSDRQWFKAKVGLDADQTHRDLAFCAHAILQSDVFIVEDTLKDNRFADNPLVTGAPHIRFYAGVPLISSNGYSLGTLCVIDTKPKTLCAEQLKSLSALGRQVINQMDLRIKNKELASAKIVRDKLLAHLSHDLISSFNVIAGYAAAISRRADKITPTQLREAAVRIEQTSLRSYSTLEGILGWVKAVTSGKSNFNGVNLSKVFQAVIDSFSDSAFEKNISIELECDNYVVIHTNECILISCLQNMISNALKFSSDGTAIRCRAVVENKQTIISVEDEGVGMTPEQIKTAFQTDDSGSVNGSHNTSSLGIGHILINDFVKTVKGSLDVQSTPDKGTIVRIIIPDHS